MRAWRRLARAVGAAGCLLIAYAGYRAFHLPRCGSGADCLQLGERYHRGKGVPVNLPLAYKFFLKACDRGAAAGCEELALFHVAGVVVPHDLARASSYYDRACRGHDGFACLSLSRAYARGSGVAKDPEKAAKAMAEAVSLLKHGCDGGEARACRWLAGLFGSGNGVDKDPPGSRRFAERACLLGEDVGCLAPAKAYLQGEYGFPRDLTRARDLLDRGCRGDRSGYSCCALATTYATGNEVEEARASALFDKACSVGQAEACVASYLRNRYISEEVRAALRAFAESCSSPYPPTGCSGGTCPLDDGKAKGRRALALKRLEVACQGERSEACLVLGLITADSKKSTALLERACSHDLAPACYRLGYDASFNKSGTLEENTRRSAELYAKACRLGLAVACPSPE